MMAALSSFCEMGSQRGNTMKRTHRFFHLHVVLLLLFPLILLVFLLWIVDLLDGHRVIVPRRGCVRHLHIFGVHWLIDLLDLDGGGLLFLRFLRGFLHQSWLHFDRFGLLR